MRLLKKVPLIEVKGCFVISDRTKRKPLGLVKRQTLRLTEPQLDKILLRKNKNKRRDVYNRMQWYIAIVRTDEIGVWKGAGSLPTKWTRGSLAQTAVLVTEAHERKPQLLKARSGKAIPG